MRIVGNDLKNTTSQLNKKSYKIKGLVLLLVLLVVVFTPILSSADTLPPSDNDDFHGSLDITADDIQLPFTKKAITTNDVVNKANPTAMHIQGREATPVLAEYFISDQDLRQLNSANNINQVVVIELYGQYNYFCPNDTCGFDYSLTGKKQIKVSFLPTRFMITFNGNGGKVDGLKVKSIELTSDKKADITVTSSNMPSEMKRKGYTFKGWSTSKDAFNSFTSNTIVTGDLTVYAQWKKVAVDKPDEPKKKEPKGKIDEIIDDHSATSTRFNIVLNELGIPTSDKAGTSQNKAMAGDSSSSNRSQYYTKAEFMSLAQDQDIPVATIGNGSVPLFAPEGAGGWAFINLLLAIVGISMALICLFISIKDGISKKSKWFIISALAGVAGLAFFFITENLNQNMVLTDKWTLISGILFVFSFVSMVLYLKQKDNDAEFAEYIHKY